MKSNLTVLIGLLLWQIHAQNFQNVMITAYNNPNEPSIIINKSNPQNIIVAENSANYYVSNDGGYTWNQKQINSSSGYCCDPALNSDDQGNIYFFHLSNPTNGSWIDRIVCQISNDGGNNFPIDTYTGLNNPKKQDKQWSAIDPANGNIYVTWTQFDQYGTNDTSKFSNILFSKSTDGGLTWSSPVQINEVSGDCIDSDNTVEGAVPAVGPNGEIYVSWVGPAGLVFDKSLDGGQTWLNNDIIINDMQGSGGWDYDIPGLIRCNGLPIIKCDVSNSPYRGTIYVNWSDQRNGINNTDIFLSKSTDGGLTWTAPVKVNDDTGNKHQFLTWMDIDQSNGYLYFIFYDRRNYNDNNTDVYMAISRDGGNTFTNVKISESPFIPDNSHFFGDYTNLSVVNGIIRPVWTRLHQNYQSLWTAILTENDLINIIPEKNIVELSIAPVPSKRYVSVKYRLKKDTQVTVNLIDNTGRLIDTLINEQWRKFGKNREVFDLDKLHLQQGIYLLQIITGNWYQTFKFIKK
jgi:hypothetical protein